FVKNLGLTAGSALPVGVPIPWPLKDAPTGWIKCNGSAFTAAQYPELARAYPSLRLPDLRGEFIRGWDDGGKIDPGRALLSLQIDSVGRHDHVFRQTWGATEGDSTGGRYPVSADTNGKLLDISISTDYYGGNETRPRNIAFNYIVRAA
ncbi:MULTISPECIES: phage tail protein, partial [Xenorhabdus]|uniref:phage tail protein n=1 Tax=Xenorhabdus TaxID=626 RepID=UPI00064A1AFC